MSLPQIIHTTSAKLNTIAVKDGQIIFTKDTKLLYADIDTVRTKIDVGCVGATGAKGATGPQGPTGPKGNNATVTIGTVTTGAAGSNASVTNSGTSAAAVLNFTIPRGANGAQGPKGDKGPNGATGKNGSNGTAATITVGTVTSGTTASVTNVGTSSAAKLNFVLPKGATGAKGDTGPRGDTGADGTDGLRQNSPSTYTLSRYSGNSTSAKLYLRLFYSNKNEIIYMYLYTDGNNLSRGDYGFQYNGSNIFATCMNAHGGGYVFVKTGLIKTESSFIIDDEGELSAGAYRLVVTSSQIILDLINTEIGSGDLVHL